MYGGVLTVPLSDARPFSRDVANAGREGGDRARYVLPMLLAALRRGDDFRILEGIGEGRGG